MELRTFIWAFSRPNKQNCPGALIIDSEQISPVESIFPFVNNYS